MSSKEGQFNPDNDIPDLSGKVVLVTGGNAGLGKETVLALSKKNPKRIHVGGRDRQRCAAAIEDIKNQVPNAPLTFLECDLASLSSVQEAARRVVAESDRLDILICNAGVCTTAGLTKDGYEITFGTNHLGHALLIKLLLPTLLHTAAQQGETTTPDVRIVSLSSKSYAGHPTGGIVFDTLRTTQDWTPLVGLWQRYGQSKLAIILYMAELARRHPTITSLSLCPGVAITGMINNLGLVHRIGLKLATIGQKMTTETASYTSLWAATASKDQVVNGTYYEGVGLPGKLARQGGDEELAKRLWDWTEKELEGYSI